MPTTAQIADILFKKQLGLGTTSSGRLFFNEPIRGRSFVVNAQIWGQSDQIPNTAPADTSGIIQKLVDYPLALVAGTSNSFTGVLLQDAIPFNWGDGTSYNYTVKDSTTAQVAFGVNDWVVDTEAGILMFNSGVPANMPPTISFYRYSGTKGFGVTTGYITTGSADQRYVQTGSTGSFATTGQILEFSTTLSSGVESQIINYPRALSSNPSSVTCEIENNVDSLIYSYVLSSVNTGGFTINFSDYLSSTGYKLYTIVST